MDCVFLGYAQRSITYRFLVVKSEVPDMHVDTIIVGWEKTITFVSAHLGVFGEGQHTDFQETQAWTQDSGLYLSRICSTECRL